MELAEVARAIGRYGWLILGLVIAAVGVAAISHLGETKTYTASARLVLDTPDPESRAESAAIADTAKALATSPSQVRDALLKARVTGRDPVRLARENISVRALGSSGIVQVSVSDTRPRAAALIANALASEVIEARLDVTNGSSQQVLTVLDRRVTRLSRRISTLDARIASLTVAAASDASSVARSRLNEAARSRDFLAQQRSVVESQRVGLLSNEALRPKPSIISRATTPPSANPSRLFPDIVLAAIVAFILSVGTIGVIETVVRNIVGGTALARAFDVPLLGTIRAKLGDQRTFDSDPGIAVRLVLAAETAGVTDVKLFPVGRPIDIAALADRLQRGSADAVAVAPVEATVYARTAEGQSVRRTSTADFAAGNRRSARGQDNRAAIAIRPFGASSSETHGRSGLVIVSPATLTKGELNQAVALVNRTTVPLLGLLAVATVAAPPLRLDEVVQAKLERFRRTG
jgi:capsular polysaccharide biosynthesis protein